MEKLKSWKGQTAIKLDGHEAPARAELKLWAWRDH